MNNLNDMFNQKNYNAVGALPISVVPVSTISGATRVSSETPRTLPSNTTATVPENTAPENPTNSNEPFVETQESVETYTSGGASSGGTGGGIVGPSNRIPDPNTQKSQMSKAPMSNTKKMIIGVVIVATIIVAWKMYQSSKTGK